MQKKVTISDHSYTIEHPTECPICHQNCAIDLIRGSEVINGSGVEIVFQCSSWKCGRHFIGRYGPRGRGVLLKLLPSIPHQNMFSESIKKVSPNFIQIYSQAEQAKLDGLDQIAGPGYRKAIEFLIKDYVKSISSATEQSQIEKAFLGEVIKSFVKDSRIQTIASRALWLGNDETHYLKKWVSQDMDDFLTLIKLTVHWVEMDQLSNQYMKKMPMPKTRKKKP